MTVFEKVIRHTLSVIDRPEDELEMIEQELRDTYAALPVVFQPRPMADSIVDSPSVVVTRLCVYSIYQKCLCVLHRKYVARGRQKSIQICHGSASDLVRQYLDIYKEFEPGGQLQTERWFMGSITWHDFLLGSTALCLTVCSTGYDAAQSANTAFVDVFGSLELLQRAKAVCEEQSTRSRDTRKVQRLIEATLVRFSSQDYGCIPTMQASGDTGQGDKNWLWNESMMNPVEDTEWAYMKQFLDLPDEYLMTDA